MRERRGERAMWSCGARALRADPVNALGEDGNEEVEEQRHHQQPKQRHQDEACPSGALVKVVEAVDDGCGLRVERRVRCRFERAPKGVALLLLEGWD